MTFELNPQSGINRKESFSNAIDKINCETMKFLHREGGRNDVVDKMSCNDFEAILSSIPEDEANTTGKFCKNINLFKDKFIKTESMEGQINAVIMYVQSRIVSKRRKGSVEDFKEKLYQIKKEFLVEIGEEPNTKIDKIEGTLSIDSSFNKGVFKLISNSKEATQELYDIYILNVFNYYALSDKYDTELKRKFYMKTKDYENNLAELKSLRSEMLKTNYYIIKENMFVNNNYEITRKGFDFRQYGEGDELFVIDFLKVSEEDGLEIENNRKDINIYYFIKPTSKMRAETGYSINEHWPIMFAFKINYFNSDTLRIVVANKLSGKIYYDKSCIYQQQFNKIK